MRPGWNVAIAAGTLACLLPGSARGAAVSPPLDLLRRFGFEERDAFELERGKILARVVDTPDRSEVASLAAMSVNARLDVALSVLRDVDARRNDAEVIAIGRVGPSPSPHELQALRLDPGDVEALRQCRVGRCELRLPAEAITRFARAVDWKSPARGQEAERVFREFLADYARDYRARGSAALVEYHDDPKPVRVRESLERLIERSSHVLALVPGLEAHLRGAGDGGVPFEDSLFWLKERFWRHTVSSLNRVTLASEPGLGVLASTQLFASHYYESSLVVVACLAAGERTYLVQWSRARADIRPSGFTWVERLLMRRLVRGRLEDQFEALRRRIESRRLAAAR